MRSSLLIVILTLLACGTGLTAPSIGSVTDNNSSYPNSVIPRYEKYEATFNVTGVGVAFADFNPFNPNTTALGTQYYNLQGIKVDASLKSPGGRSISWPAFWYKAPDGSTSWKLRFAPIEVGTWTFTVTAQHASGTTTSQQYSFTCGNSTSHGFIGVNTNDRRFFRFSDGTQFFPIGTDMSGCDDPPPGTTPWGMAFPKMKAVGANFTRVFFTSLNIEPYNVDSDKSELKALDNYDMNRALTVDQVVDLAHSNGIYMEWLLDDSTYIADQSSQYIAATGRQAPCTDVNGFFSLPAAKEIYKRKLRYWMARWGYSVNLMNLELMNEIGDSGSTATWHVEMGNYLHGYSDQSHLVSSSNGSGEMRINGVPWNDASMDYVNYHDYAKYTQGWAIKTDYPLEQLGSSLQFPWEDFAVYADRVARLQFKRYKWNKPLCWSEIGLIYRRPGDDDFPDWDLAYQKDTSAHHVKDGLWAAMLNGMAFSHWKLDYILGNYGGGDKFSVCAPLANYVSGESFEGLTQETTYPVADPLNPSPQVKCSNPGLMVVSMHGPNKAFVYVKNLSDTWFRDYYYSQTTDRYADASKIPTPASCGGTIAIAGMTHGQYNLEKWSTTDGNPSTQVSARTTITVGSDGIASFSVSNLSCDAAFKIKQVVTPPPSITISLSVDKSAAKPGDTLTYTVTYANTGTGAAENAVISVPLPPAVTFIAAGNGSSYDGTSQKVVWTVPSVAPGGSGSVSFQAQVN
jgi:uncharacterized repeat protein (TIGR01451 family)